MATVAGMACAASFCGSSARGADQPLPSPPAEVAGPGGPVDQPTTIDLSSALRLAGVQNLQIVVAQQRVEAAVAVQQLAADQILPNINFGTNYDSHNGVLQSQTGQIIQLNRSALYAGAGASAIGSATVQIPGVQYNINISAAVFNYLVTRQITTQSRFDRQAVDNQVLLNVAMAYAELLRTSADVSLAILTRNDIGEVARLTAANAKTGQGRQADANRAASELAQREQDVAGAEARRLLASHRLCELLNLDTTTQLRPLESQVVPEPVVPTRIPLTELIATALLHRPELSARRTAVKAALLELRSAKLLPFSPTVLGGFSDGVFGGGSSIGSSEGLPRFDTFADRSDVDVVVYWTLRNLGLGNKALIDAARARLGESQLEEMVVLDRVRQEVATAYVRSQARFAEIGMQAQAVRLGTNAMREDLQRIRGQQGLPIELLDSLRQAATARTDYLHAIIGFDEAEFQLYVALGAPPADTLPRPVPEEVMHPPTQILKP
ncbi:MAG TPA: TolC family protein [Planctomycetaceae bacterium]|nr:TolC family protein [Planctomycetaceae bacterium]